MSIKDIRSNPHISIRMSQQEKEEFQQCAAKDGKALSTWLKWLGRRRVEEVEMEEFIAGEIRKRRGGS